MTMLSPMTDPTKLSEVIDPIQLSEVDDSNQLSITHPTKLSMMTNSIQPPEMTDPIQISKTADPTPLPEMIHSTQLSEMLNPTELCEISNSIGTSENKSTTQMTSPTKISEMMDPTQMSEITNSTQISEMKYSTAMFEKTNLNNEEFTEIELCSGSPIQYYVLDNKCPRDIIDRYEGILYWMPYNFIHYSFVHNVFLIIGPLNPAIHGIRVASVIAFSVCLSVCFLCVLLGYVTNFLILLQHNIRLLSRNCDMCAPEFVARVNLRRHDTLTQSVMNLMTIFC